eukprot:comp19853_c0_seq1/m.38488 comp19853_c0_seq1/g.38488  ORF comp19853_c0_seq1/g.38488 comp19853_c0_seq1/m.38488 type:complete len:445 (-) comp19853_c0_seq1:52-1386(-)
MGLGEVIQNSLAVVSEIQFTERSNVNRWLMERAIRSAFPNRPVSFPEVIRALESRIVYDLTARNVTVGIEVNPGQGIDEYILVVDAQKTQAAKSALSAGVGVNPQNAEASVNLEGAATNLLGFLESVTAKIGTTQSGLFEVSTGVDVPYAGPRYSSIGARVVNGQRRFLAADFKLDELSFATTFESLDKRFLWTLQSTSRDMDKLAGASLRTHSDVGRTHKLSLGLAMSESIFPHRSADGAELQGHKIRAGCEVARISGAEAGSADLICTTENSYRNYRILAPGISSSLGVAMQGAFPLSSGRLSVIDGIYLDMPGFQPHTIGPSEPRTGDKGGVSFTGAELALQADARVLFRIPTAIAAHTGTNAQVFVNAGWAGMSEDLYPSKPENAGSPFTTLVNGLRVNAGIGIVQRVGPFALELSFNHPLRVGPNDRTEFIQFRANMWL